MGGRHRGVVLDIFQIAEVCGNVVTILSCRVLISQFLFAGCNVCFSCVHMAVEMVWPLPISTADLRVVLCFHAQMGQVQFVIHYGVGFELCFSV